MANCPLATGEWLGRISLGSIYLGLTWANWRGVRGGGGGGRLRWVTGEMGGTKCVRFSYFFIIYEPVRFGSCICKKRPRKYNIFFALLFIRKKMLPVDCPKLKKKNFQIDTGLIILIRPNGNTGTPFEITLTLVCCLLPLFWDSLLVQSETVPYSSSVCL